MVRLAKLQFLGPFIVLLTVAMAEGAALALAKFPTSETLWYLNLRVFAVFQTSYGLLCSSWGLPYAQFYLIALPPFALAVVGLLARQRILLAAASQLSFVYAGFLIYCGVHTQGDAATASLIGILIPTNSSFLLPVILTVACLISFLVSQSQYLVVIFKSHAPVQAIPEIS